VLPLVPDLSHDVVMTPTGPRISTRTTRLGHVDVESSAAIAGFRLPIAATAIHLDRAWAGWRSADAPEEKLVGALHAGAVAWSEDELVTHYLQRLGTSGADIAITAIASDVFVSERTLRRRLLKVLGVGPVYVRRVVRLHRLAQLRSRSSVVDAVTTAGYADQAHASRDIRSLLGFGLRRFAEFDLSD
jgi:AraC-like DNA-binding protein